MPWVSSEMGGYPLLSQGMQRMENKVKVLKKCGGERNSRLKFKNKRKKHYNQPSKFIAQNVVWLLWWVFPFLCYGGRHSLTKSEKRANIPKASRNTKKKANFMHGTGWGRARIK